MCLNNDEKTAHASKFIKSRIMNNVIDSILSIDTFEQQYVVLKGIIQSPHLKYYVKTIDIDQSLSNNAILENKFLQKPKKLYKNAGKCDNQQQFKDILEASMVSTIEGFTDKSHRYTMAPTPVKKPSDRK